MKIEITIDDRLLTPFTWLKTRLGLVVVAFLLGAGVAWAAVGDPIPNPPADGAVLSAIGMQENFDELRDQVSIANDVAVTNEGAIAGLGVTYDSYVANNNAITTSSPAWNSVTLLLDGTYRCEYTAMIQNDGNQSAGFQGFVVMSTSQSDSSGDINSSSGYVVTGNINSGGADTASTSGFALIQGTVGQSVHVKAWCNVNNVCTLGYTNILCTRLGD